MPIRVCRDCVNLVVIQPETNERVEATQQIRKNGEHYAKTTDGCTRPFSAQPICRAWRMPTWNDHERPRTPGDFALMVSTGVDCDSFSRYEPGLSPKALEEKEAKREMLEMQDKLLKLQESVFAWRQQQAENDERLTKQIQALEQIRHNENRAEGVTDRKTNNWVAIGIAVFCRYRRLGGRGYSGGLQVVARAHAELRTKSI